MHYNHLKVEWDKCKSCEVAFKMSTMDKAITVTRIAAAGSATATDDGDGVLQALKQIAT